MHPFAILAPAWRRAPAAGIVAGALQEVEEIFRRQLRSDLPAVNELARHVERGHVDLPARDDAFRRLQWRAAFNESDVGAGAAHVERDEAASRVIA